MPGMQEEEAEKIDAGLGNALAGWQLDLGPVALAGPPESRTSEVLLNNS